MKRITFTFFLVLTAFFASVFAQNVTKVFRGEIDGNRIQMTLKRDGKKLSGTYYYQKVRKDLRLSGAIDDEGNFKMDEFAPNGAKTGEFSGKWRIDEEEGKVNLLGEWVNPKTQEKIYFSINEQFAEFTGKQRLDSKFFSEKNKPKLFEITAEYPVLSGVSPAFAANFNKSVSAEMLKNVNGFRKNMLSMTADDLKFQRESGISNYLEMNYVVEQATDRFISIGFYFSTYEGGAHPNHYSSSFNFDLKTGKQIKLKDLFKPGANYLKTISGFCINNLKEASVSDDDWIETGAGPDLKNYQSWNITKKGILVVFDPYQVASYAAGPQEVLIPFDELKSILKKGGVIQGF